LLHGYALGEAIVGAEPTPLFAYFAGLALAQSVIAIGIMLAARMVLQPVASELAPVRLLGAGVVGVGLTLLAAQLIPGA
jgi:urease accessory protein